MPTLALIDGHSIAYRAFFALPPDLATTSGQVTNAAYGFTRMLIKLLADHHPDGLAVAWDVSRQTFRTEAYSDYKAQRAAAPDAFKSQLPLIQEVLSSLGIRQIQQEGFEADDVIASVSEVARQAGWHVLLVTGDRDAFQLVDDHLKVLYTRRGITDVVVADAAWVEDRYGIRPDQYVDYAALRGDSSDNLPGVPGVGEKTAARLVATYGHLEGIYEKLNEQSPKLAASLAAHRDQIFLNRRLMVLVKDLDVQTDLGNLGRGGWDRSRAKQLFESLEFYSLWDDLLLVQPDPAAVPGEALDAEIVVVTDPAKLAELAKRRPLVLDLIADWGVAVATGGDSAAGIPFEALLSLAGQLTDPLVPKVAHDAKGLIRAVMARGLGFAGLASDTAIAAYLLNPATRAYELNEVAARYLGVEVESPDREDGEAGRQGTLDLAGGPDLEAAARRVVTVDRLSGRMDDEIAERGMTELYREVEVPLVTVLAEMEERGIGVDRAYLEELGESIRDQLATLERKVHEAAGEPFNVNSTKDLREVLYNKLQLPVLKKTPHGVPSTDHSVLEKLAVYHPMLEHLLKYRELEKLRSTYVDGYLPLITPEERIHTRFNQMAATTGRLSSDTPNLQNIPVRSETGRTIRRAFVPTPGWTFVVADYSQIELRVLAHTSGDPFLVDAFRSDTDIHLATAARVFGLEPSQVTPEMRRRAKMINFGLLYGMEAFGLADRLGISKEEARQHIDAYFAQFPKVRQFMADVVTTARNTGYTTTLFGRRRHLPELKSDNFRVRQMGERMALNAPVQGSAADIIKRAMIALHAALGSARLETAMVLQVHDELVLESPPGEIEEAGRLIVLVMENVVKLDIPLRVDLATGANLAETKAR